MRGSGGGGRTRLALSILIRLDPDRRSPPWGDWQALDAAELEHGPARKRLPTPERTYFTPHVKRVLFPGSSRGVQHPGLPGGRAIDIPHGARLLTGARAGKNAPEVEVALRLDLLEQFDLEVGPGALRFGAVHLSADGTELGRGPDCIASSRDLIRRLTMPYFRRGDVAGWSVATRLELDGEAAMLHRPVDRGRGARPVVALAEALGWEVAAEWRSRRAFHVAMVAAGSLGPEAPAAAATLATLPWSSEVEAPQAELRVGPFDAAVEVSGAAFVTDGTADTDGRTGRAGGRGQPRLEERSVVNLRSYWVESLLLAVCQQEALGEFSGGLAAAGPDPTGPRVGALYKRWLTFRNVLWWSSPAVTAIPPRELVRAYRSTAGSERLFAEVEGDLATYVSDRRRALDESQSEALNNVQVFGAALAVVGAAATLATFVFDSAGAGVRVLIAVVILVMAAGAGLAVHALVRGRDGAESDLERSGSHP